MYPLVYMLAFFFSTVGTTPVDHSSLFTDIAPRDTSARGTITFSYPSPNVTKATFNNGPINLIDRAFESDILDFLYSLQNVTASTPKVVIFDSANPDFYLGHVDLTSLESPSTESKTEMGEDYVTLTRLLQNITSTIFIAEINGRAFGADQEVAAQMDMRFVGPNARTGSFEEALGLTAGGGSQTFLGSIIGKGRALEYLLAAKTFDGPTGERLGLFNKYYDDATTLTTAVESLAERIALFPRTALNQTKSVLSYLNPPIKALEDDVEVFYHIEPLVVEQANIKKVIELSQNQSAGAFELGLGDSLLGLYERRLKVEAVKLVTPHHGKKANSVGTEPAMRCFPRPYPLINPQGIQRSGRRSFLSVHYPSPIGKDWGHPPSATKVDDSEILKLANKPLHTLRLADLVAHGRPPLSQDALFSSANFTLSLLPVRLAHRIQALQNLPFIVVSNPNISKIYNNYLHSLSTLLPWGDRKISTLEDEVQFTSVLADLVDTHSNTIPILARGFLECRKYINPKDVTAFLDEHLRARIGTRLIAEQHIALHSSSQPHHASYYKGGLTPSSYIGVIDTALEPASTIDSCGNFVSDICEYKYGVRPTWIIDGEPSTTLAYVPVHLEYIITEILKNSFRATVESGSKEPVVITIAAEPNLPTAGNGQPPGKEKESKEVKLIEPLSDSAPGVTIRVRDRGGGIDPAILPNIYSYSFTTFSGDDDLPTTNTSMDALNTISSLSGEQSSIAGLGYGLPLGRAYAEYFGGSISIESLWGWGTDVYLRVKGVGKID